jgi:hypothetical protein
LLKINTTVAKEDWDQTDLVLLDGFPPQVEPRPIKKKKKKRKEKKKKGGVLVSLGLAHVMTKEGIL